MERRKTVYASSLFLDACEEHGIDGATALKIYHDFMERVKENVLNDDVKVTFRDMFSMYTEHRKGRKRWNVRQMELFEEPPKRVVKVKVVEPLKSAASQVLPTQFSL